MPLIIAALVVSRVLRRITGEDKRDEKRRNELGNVKIAYKKEFVRFFPTVLSVLVGRKTSVPRLTTAYDHLEKVCTIDDSIEIKVFGSSSVHFNFIVCIFAVTQLQCIWR